MTFDLASDAMTAAWLVLSSALVASSRNRIFGLVGQGARDEEALALAPESVPPPWEITVWRPMGIALMSSDRPARSAAHQAS